MARPIPRPDPPEEDGSQEIEPGRRLIRVAADKSQSLAERLAAQLHRLAWRTPLHNLRLRGRYPLKLLGVPPDPIPGDVGAGRALMGGRMIHLGESLDLDGLDFAALDVSPGFVEALHGFAWLRDLAFAAPRDRAAPVAEAITREWLAKHGAQVAEPGVARRYRRPAYPRLGRARAADPVEPRHRLSLCRAQRAGPCRAPSRSRRGESAAGAAAPRRFFRRDRRRPADPRRRRAPRRRRGRHCPCLRRLALR